MTDAATQFDEADPVARAAALVPFLLDNAAEAETLRRVPDSNVAALKKAGLYRVLLPKRLGGLETDFHTHLDVVAEAARGCGSTAWCLGVAQVHSWLLAHFPAEAQEEIYGVGGPDTIAAAVLTMRGLARRTGNGFTVDGRWPFGSHSQHARWIILGAQIEGAEPGPAGQALFAFPAADVQILDDWRVAGLRGTGSCSLVVTGKTVPAHRILSMADLLGGTSPGRALNTGSLYRSEPLPVLELALTGSAIGMARGALDAFKATLPGRIVAYTANQVQLDAPATHRMVADVAARIDAAALMLHRAAGDIDRAAAEDKRMALANRARIRMDCAFAVRQCLEAAEQLFLAGGGSGLAEKSPIQRAARDLHAVNLHGVLALEPSSEAYGRVLLGLDPNTPFV